MLKELCIAIIAISSANSESNVRPFFPERRRQTNYQIIIAGALIALGLTVVVARVAEVKISTIIPFLVGSILITGGLTMLLTIGRPHRLRPDSDAPIKQATIDKTTELLTRVEFVDTYTRTQAGDVKLEIPGYGMSASATQGSQFARLPLSDIDVVRELRDIVHAVAEEGWQVVIAIDELDKMRDAEEAMAFLNHIKVLFPIHGCSFIVSVSEDGWARFERRGLPRRDTFDSSFDEVVRVKMLTPAESRDFLKRRSSNITDTQALLCHCLSGGLPRDLLRAARQLGQLANRAPDKDGSGPLLCDVLTILLREKLKDKLEACEMSARVRTVGTVITKPWLSIWPDQQETERLLTGICAAHSQNSPAILSQGDSQETENAPSDKDYIETYIAVLHTIRQAFWTRWPPHPARK